MGPLSNVEPKDRRAALGAFFTLFGIIAAHTLTETARDAMFLAKLPAHHLAGVYFAIAVLSVVLTPIEHRILRRFGGALGLGVLLLGGAAMLLLFHSMSRTGTHYTFIALYVYSSLFATLVTIHFWLLLGFKYTVTEAKRLYGFIGAGSVVGAVAGAGLARVLTEVFDPRRLLLAAAVFLVLSAAGVLGSLRKAKVAPAVRRDHTLAENVALFREDPYVRKVALLVLASTVVFTVSDYVFKSVVSHHVAPERLGRFFAMTYTALNVVALVAQLGVVSWLIRTAGVTRALAILPVLLLIGGVGLAAGGGMAAVLLLKGSDGGLRHSLHRTGVELLYVPIADGVRARLKALIDGVGQRGGQAIGSILILAGIRFGHDSEALLGGVVAALSVLWLLGVGGLRRHYLDLFRGTLARGAPMGRLELPALDVRSLETLIASLNSPDDREVLATLDLLDAQDKVRLVPALILYHPSQAIVLRALEMLAASRRKDHLPLLKRLVHHGDAEIRAAALGALVAIDPSSEALPAGLSDSSPIVRATALVEAVAIGHDLATPELGRAVEELATWPEAALLAFVRAIRRRPAAPFEPVLCALARSTVREVRVEVARAMGEMQRPSFVTELVPLLSDPDARAAARNALLAIGVPALEAMDRALDDPATPLAVRRHLPRTISRFEPASAAPVLLSHLARSSGMVRYKLLRGLGSLVRRDPELPLDRALVLDVAQQTIDAAFEMLGHRLALVEAAAEHPEVRTPTHELVVLLLANKESLATERLFRLLDLLHPREDFERIYRGLTSEDPTARASSRELIEHVVHPDLRAAVLALVEETTDEARLAQRKPREPAAAYAAELSSILETPSESLRSLVAHHIGELGLVSLHDALVAARPRRADGPLTAVFARALARLDAARGEVARAG